MNTCTGLRGSAGAERIAVAASMTRWAARRALHVTKLITHRERPYPSRVFDGVRITLREPRLTDAASWQATRLAERARLEDLLGRSGLDWSAAQSELVWTERCVRLRRATAHGVAWAAVLVTDVPDERVGSDETIVGEVDVDGVDRRTATGELFAWTSRTVPPGAVVQWAAAAMTLRTFVADAPLARMVAPVAVDNPAPLASLRALGFTPETRLTQHRGYRGAPTDHDLWVLHNATRTRDLLYEIVAH